MIVVLQTAPRQLASLGIRNEVARITTWLGTSGAASALTFVSWTAAALPYVALFAFALRRLTRRYRQR